VNGGFLLIKNKHLVELVKGATSSFMVKVASAAVSLLFYLHLGRMLGADGAGIFFLTLTVLTIASVVARFGLENTLLRKAPQKAIGGSYLAHTRRA